MGAPRNGEQEVRRERGSAQGQGAGAGRPQQLRGGKGTQCRDSAYLQLPGFGIGHLPRGGNGYRSDQPADRSFSGQDQNKGNHCRKRKTKHNKTVKQLLTVRYVSTRPTLSVGLWCFWAVG